MLTTKPSQTAEPSAASQIKLGAGGRAFPASKAPSPAVRVSVLHEIFESQADLRPTAVAVAFGQDKMSYGRLERRANRLAHYLRARGVQRGSQVAMLLPKSVDAYVALLGILKAGAAYVPIDSDYPPDRIAYILENSDAAVLVTTATLAERQPEFSAAIVRMDTDRDAIAAESSARLTRSAVGAGPRDLCYIIYTSGSTGRPKGVMIEHRSACHLVCAEGKIFQVQPEDRVYQGFSLSFDASVEEVWLAFHAGATLVAATPEMAHAGPDLSRMLTDAGVTVLSCVPTLLSMLNDDMPKVRLLIFGGESCPDQLVERWARPGRRMVNTYGPTEATVIATYADLVAGKSVTIGRAVPGYRIYLFDEGLRPVSRGETGEIWIGGVGVARGYVGLQGTTEARFLPDPFAPEDEPDAHIYRTGDLGRLDGEGNIEFLGRADSQVKIRGFRVELTEIESVMMQGEGVLTAACALREDSPGAQQLVGYIVPSDGEVNEDHLRSLLRNRLPSYMVPALIETVTELPKLPSGKLDRASLPPPRPRVAAPQSTVKDPRTETERRITAVWEKLFHPQPVSIDDNFFLDLGGHSLLAARMVSELRKEPQFASVSMADVYDHPTITSLATALDAETERRTAEVQLPRPATKERGEGQSNPPEQNCPPLPGPLLPRREEQRYLILECKVWIFEDMIHQHNEFAHDGGEGDFGGFACCPQPLIKLFELTIGVGGDKGRHVEGATDRSAPTPDAPASVPLTALTRMRGQSGQGCRLAAIERAQFGQFGQHAQGGDRADASDGFEFLHAFIHRGDLGAQFLELSFDLFEIPFESAHEALGLASQRWHGETLGLLPLGDEDFQHLHPAADQFGQLLFRFGAGCGGFGLQGLAVGRQDGGINVIGLGALAGSAREVADARRVQDADGHAGFMQCGDDVPFVTAGGFADDVNAGLGRQEFEQSAMTGGGVGQVVDTPGEVELQVALGNIQARVDSGHSVLALSCKCELAVVGRSINGSSLGHRHERLKLLTHLVTDQCQRVTNSSAPLPCRLQAAGQSHLPKPSLPDKGRGKFRYKREKNRSAETRRHFCAGALQSGGLYFVYAFRALQWVTPYLIYFMLLETGHSVPAAAGWAAISAIAVLPALLLVAIATKWLVLGKIQPGRYPLWGGYYLRFWFVRSIVSALHLSHLCGTPLMPLVFRLFGARIGKNVHLETDQLVAFDLISIGDDTSVDDTAWLLGCAVEEGELVVGPIEIGRGCFIGTRCVLRENTVVEDGARLEDLSLLPSGARVPAGETWAGSPARPTANSTASTPPPPVRSPLQRVLSIALYALLVLVIPALPLLAFVPGVALLMRIDPLAQPLLYLAVAPLVGASFVLLLTIGVVVFKRLLVGRVQAGTYPVHGSFYVRKWIVDQLLALSLDVAGSLHATLYLSPWYRALGAKLGKYVELSTATSTTPDLLEIDDGGTVADEVSFGAARIEGGWMTLAPTRLGKRAFVGNGAVLPPGTVLGDNSLVGVLSIPPAADAPEAGRPNVSWLGSPPILLPRRQASTPFSDQKTYCPSRKIRLARAACEIFRVTMPPAGFIIVTTTVIVATLALWEHIGLAAAFLLLPLVYAAGCVALSLVVAALKWILMGRFRPFEYPLLTPFVWRLEFVNALYEFLVTPLALEALQGTPFLPWYYRLLGARIGRRTYFHTTGLIEFDLVEVGDEAVVNEDCVLQTHLFEDRVLKADKLRVGRGCVMGAGSVVLYNSVMEDGSSLDALSLLMKGETLPAGTSWEGSPARRRAG